MSVDAQPGASFVALADAFATGLTGTLQISILDGAGTVVFGPSTAGISEAPAASGNYRVTLTAPSTQGQYSLYWLDAASGDNASENLVVAFLQTGPAGPPGPSVAGPVGPAGPAAYPTLLLQPLVPVRPPLVLQPPSGFGTIDSRLGDPITVLYGQDPHYVTPYQTSIFEIDQYGFIWFGQNYLAKDVMRDNAGHANRAVFDGLYSVINNRWFMRQMQLLEIGDTVDFVIARGGPNNDRPYGLHTNPLGGATGVAEGSAIGGVRWHVWENAYGGIPNWTVGGQLSNNIVTMGAEGIQIPRDRTGNGDRSGQARVSWGTTPLNWPTSLVYMRLHSTGHFGLGVEGIGSDPAVMYIRATNGQNEKQNVKVSATAGTFNLQFVVSTPAVTGHPAAPSGGETAVSGVQDGVVWLFATCTTAKGETTCSIPRRVGNVPTTMPAVDDVNDPTYIDADGAEVIGDPGLVDPSGASVTGKVIFVKLAEDLPPTATSWNLYVATGSAVPTTAYLYQAGITATHIDVQGALPTTGPMVPTTDTASETSPDIAYNADVATVQAALDAMTLLGAGQTVVTGAAGAYVVEFTGTLKALRLNRLQGIETNLTGTVSTPIAKRGRPNDNTIPVLQLRTADSATDSYLMLEKPAVGANATIPAVRFNANQSTHPALTPGTTKTSPGTVSAWILVEVGTTTMYVPCYTSTTS